MAGFVRELGRTGLMVSRIGLGLAAVGRPAYITLGRAMDLGADRSVEALQRRSHVLLDAAFTAGVRYVDAARSYGALRNSLGPGWPRATSRRARSRLARSGATAIRASGGSTPGSRK
jgi:aryl-alcohol dehydrogenase-like predicted oxidoreductase